MKVIFSIAKNEFRYLFYSPIAWFVFLVFFIQCAYFYSTPLYGLANLQDVNLKNMTGFKGFSNSITQYIFLRNEFFSNVMRNLYLFIPILTMGLIGREYNNGTSALLFSSPVSLRRVVLGKYLGIMLYNLLLVLVIVIFLVAGMINIQSVDYGALLSALLGFYLLVCSYSAIGLFMSSLSQYQVVTAIGTFMVIFILSVIGSLWQRYDFVRDLTWFLSLQDRTYNMVKGLIVTKDIIYFLLVTLMFLTFTFFRLSARLEFRPWYIRTGRHIAVLGIVLLVGYISSRPALTGYLDATATQRNTIHPKTQATLAAFKDSTLEVTLYVNLLGKGLMNGMPEKRNVDYFGKFWELYLRFKPDIKFNFVYYYGNNPAKDDSALLKRVGAKSLMEIAQARCYMMGAPLSMFRSEAEIQPAPDLASEDYRVVMQLKYQGRTTFLRTYEDNDFWPYEEHVIAAMSRLLGVKMPSVAYSTGFLERDVFGHGERGFAKHATFRGSRKALVNTGFDIDSINLQTQDIPDSLTLLVLADPKMEISTTVQQKISDYISKGGNLMISGEPGKQYVLNPVLAQLGMQLEEGQLVYPTYDETPDKILARLSGSSRNISEELSYRFKKKSIFVDSFSILMPGATRVVNTGSHGWITDSLANTVPGKSWIRKGPLVIDSTLPPFNPAEGDIRLNSFPTVQSLKRKINGKEQRIIVTGDADFASNTRQSRNRVFLIPAYTWLTGGSFPVHLQRKESLDLLLNAGERMAHYQKILFIWVLPAILLLAGTVLLIRRKRK